ncbi:hypothetical protein ACFL14_00610 [Patescibacteria group bacterium]
MTNLSAKASNRVGINRSLIAIAIGIFFLTVNLKKQILMEEILALQLVLSIPMLLVSTLAYTKLGYREKTEKWNILAWVTFIFGYTFLLNIIGILLNEVVGLNIALIYFIVTWLVSLAYSVIDISYNRPVWKERLIKDIFFTLILIIFGILPALGVFC